MRYISHSILVTELYFALKICKFWFFWNSREIPEFIVEFEKIYLGYDMGCQFHLVSSSELNFWLSIFKHLYANSLKKYQLINSAKFSKVWLYMGEIKANLHIVRDTVGIVFDSYVIQILRTTFWTLNFHTPHRPQCCII